jgi:hypothetical protein
MNAALERVLLKKTFLLKLEYYAQFMLFNIKLSSIGLLIIPNQLLFRMAFCLVLPPVDQPDIVWKIVNDTNIRIKQLKNKKRIKYLNAWHKNKKKF